LFYVIVTIKANYIPIGIIVRHNGTHQNILV